MGSNRTIVGLKRRNTLLSAAATFAKAAIAPLWD